MTANAIAAKLSKKLLLVNLPLLQQQNVGKSSSQESSKYQSIFREAELSDAIVFFDECEVRQQLARCLVVLFHSVLCADL